MYEVKAIASFDHHGNRKVGDRFSVGSQRQAEDLVKKGLVEVLGAAVLDATGTATSNEVGITTGGGAAVLDAGGTATSGEVSTTAAASVDVKVPGARLVEGNAADVIAAVAGLQDKSLLQIALDAEKAGKDRKTVVEALEAALKVD